MTSRPRSGSSRGLAALVALALTVAPALRAQDGAKGAKGEKSAKGSPAAKAAKAEKKAAKEDLADTARLDKRERKALAMVSRFWDQPPLEVTLSMDMKQIRGDRQDGAPWRPATLAYAAEGRTVSVPLRVRTRGIWRLKHCKFPPLRLDFGDKAAEGTAFEGLDRPKLVSVCTDDDVGDRYVLQEMQLYRVQNLLTPASHHVRALRITYVDAGSGKTEMTRWAFLSEEPEQVAARLRGYLIEEKGARADDLDAQESARFGVFQYFIGNADFAIGALHNVELVRTGFGVHVPVAYDFDYSGAVDARYATPPAQLNIRKVTERIYRGYCTRPGEIEKAAAAFVAKKDEIARLYDDPIGRLLPPDVSRRTLAYFDTFYRDAADPRTVKREMADVCLK